MKTYQRFIINNMKKEGVSPFPGNSDIIIKTLNQLCLSLSVEIGHLHLVALRLLKVP